MSGEPVAVFERIGVALSQQEIRKLAPFSARLCDIYLEQRGHVLFGFKKGKGSRSLRLMAHALQGDVDRPRCAIGSGVTHTWRRFFFCSVARRCTVRPHGFQSSLSSTVKPDSCQGILSKPATPKHQQPGSSKILRSSLSVVQRLRVPGPEKLTSRR